MELVIFPEIGLGNNLSTAFRSARPFPFDNLRHQLRKNFSICDNVCHNSRSRKGIVKRVSCSYQTTSTPSELTDKSPESFKTLYPSTKSHQKGTLSVSIKHKLYFEVFGNPNGIPALFLHGGPGAGCYPNHARFFDPAHFRIVLFDQRGCGASQPTGCLDENTTQDLVEDIEKLRTHLNVQKWILLGGSWGVTLALVYAQTHPERVAGMVLRGVCLLRREEIEWFYKTGASCLLPFHWEQLNGTVPLEERSNLVNAFYKRLTSQDSKTRDAAASAWLTWESALSNFQETSSVFAWDGSQYSFGGEIMAVQPSPLLPSPQNILSFKEGEKPALEVSEKLPQRTVQARLECHYFYHNGFLRENQILEDVGKIRHIPCVMVQGRYDFVCPVKNAFDLHRAWPEAELKIVPNSGHSMYERRITHHLILATEKFRELDLQ